MAARHTHNLRSRRRWLVALCLVGIVVLHACIILRLFLSPEQFRLRTQAVLRQHWPGKVALGRARYEFPAGFRLEDIGLDRAAKLGGEALLRAKALKMHCDLASLLRGKVSIVELVVDEPELFLRPADVQGQRGARKKPPQPAIERIFLRGGRIHVGEGVLHQISKGQLPISVRAHEVHSLNVALRRDLRLANGFAVDGEAESDLWGRCTIKGTIDLQAERFDALVVASRIAIGPRLRELLPPKALAALDRYHFQGAVTLKLKLFMAWGQEAPQWDLAATAELLDCTAQWKNFPVPIRDLRGQVEFDGTNVYYRKIQGRAGGATITLDGATTRDKVEFDFSAYGRALDQELFAAASPPLQRLWKRCGVQGGTMDVQSHSVWHRIERQFEAAVTLRLRDGKATHQGFPYPLTDLSGVFTWRGSGKKSATGDHVPGVTQIRELAGRHGNARVEITGEGTDDGVVNITIHATQVPLDKVLHSALHERWRKIYDQFRPTGTASVEVQITGPTKPPHVPQYRIAIRPEGVSFRHVKFPHPIDNVRGEIRIDEKGRVTLHDLTGRLGEVPLKFLGSVRAGPEGPVSDITVLAPEVELGPPVRALLAKSWATVHDQLDPRGVVSFVWKLNEDPAAGVSRQSIEVQCLRQCSIQHARFPVRIEGLLGRIYIDGDGHAIFTGMKGRIGKAVVEAIEGEYVPGAEGGLRFILKAGSLAFNDTLKAALPVAWRTVWDELQPRGEADVEYQLVSDPTHTDPKHPAAPQQRVSIEPRNLAITCRKFPLPCTEIARGKVTFDHQGNATISGVQGKVRGNTLLVTGKVTGGDDSSVLHLEASARKLLLDDELRKALPKEWQPTWDSFHPSGAADVELVLDGDLRRDGLKLTSLRAVLDDVGATYAALPTPLTGLRGRIEFENGVATLTDVAGRSPLSEQVRLDGRVATDGTGSTRLHVRAQNVAIQPKLLDVLPKGVAAALRDIELAGTADLDVTVALDGKGARDATFAGTVGLRRCSFKRGHPVQELDGDLRIEKATVSAKGQHAFAGSLALRKLVARKLTATGLQGQFAYAAEKDEDGAGRARLSLSGLQGALYGGRLTVPKAEIDLATGRVTSVSLRLADVDFKEFCGSGLGYKGKVSGAFALSLDLPPATPETGDLVGSGTARVEHGELGSLPVTAAVFDFLSFQLPERSISKGEIRFDVGRERLVVSRIALGREGWLMTGSGTVGYDQTLSLKFVTPKTGSILALPRIIAGSLVEIDVGGTLDKPVTGQTIAPVKRVYDEFRKLFKGW